MGYACAVGLWWGGAQELGRARTSGGGGGRGWEGVGAVPGGAMLCWHAGLVVGMRWWATTGSQAGAVRRQ